MVCSCGDRDNSHLLTKAYDILNGADVSNFLTRATYWINGFNCHIELVSDQWAGVDIICTEWNEDEEDDEDAPEWITTLKFRVECDKVEEGLARAVIHIHEMHLAFNPDSWYTKHYNSKENA
jgi:hypothetical protein